MTQFYDATNNRLVYIQNKASSDYWDNHWESEHFENLVKIKNNPFIIDNTKKYLSPGARLIEGGCGRGDKVFTLKHHGYEAVGLDYAKETVNKIKEVAPELDIVLGDVRKLDFPDESFDGYWSLGVIEHFYEGYKDIASEMHRVIKKDGYLFMTVPSMSPLRKLKSALNIYPKYEHSTEIEKSFYQFALSPESVIKHFESLGFKLLEHNPYDGVKGLKDEILILRPFLQWVYGSKNIIGKVIRKLLNLTIGKFSNHMSFYIFKK